MDGGATATIVISAVMSAAASAAAAYSSYQASRRQAEALEANAKASRRDAMDEVWSAQQDTRALARQRRMMLGRQATMYGAAGVEMTGSPLEVMADTAAQYERDIATRAWVGGTRREAKLYEAQLMEWQADQARDTGKLNMMVGLLGAGAKAASSIYGATAGVGSAPAPSLSTENIGGPGSATSPLSDWSLGGGNSFDDYWTNRRMRAMWAGSLY